ncbi:unnamed protein product [Somion occarium]|uniref:DUF6534 domain-containing protein n=1 Tax=Somion occarium TaxID=3059160 RepID=A0ABP1CTV1_9APHY
MDPSTTPPFSAARLMGGMVVGISVSFILYGVTCVQVYSYVTRAQKDPHWMKVLVWAVWILDTVHSVVVLRQLYFYTVISFGDYTGISFVDWSVPAALFTQNALLMLVESFYIHRIWMLSYKSWLLTSGLAILLILRLGFSLTTAVFATLGPTWTSFQNERTPEICIVTGDSLSSIVDGLIAICMIYFLWKSQAGLQRMNTRLDNIIHWVMAYSVNTGAIVMIASTAISITYRVLKGSLVFTGIVVIATKLYSNSLLGVLNAKHLLNNKLNVQFTLDSTALEPIEFQVISSTQSIQLLDQGRGGNTQVSDKIHFSINQTGASDTSKSKLPSSSFAQ